MTTIKATEFLAGRPQRENGLGHHNYHAERHPRGGVIVTQEGKPVKVNCAGTTDNRTVYAYVEGVGFIGGWQYPHKAQPFQALVESINRGILYLDQCDLPKSSKATKAEPQPVTFPPAVDPLARMEE